MRKSCATHTHADSFSLADWIFSWLICVLVIDDFSKINLVEFNEMPKVGARYFTDLGQRWWQTAENWMECDPNSVASREIFWIFFQLPLPVNAVLKEGGTSWFAWISFFEVGGSTFFDSAAKVVVVTLSKLVNMQSWWPSVTEIFHNFFQPAVTWLFISYAHQLRAENVRKWLRILIPAAQVFHSGQWKLVKC